METIYRKIPVSIAPPTWGWYDTDKGKLFWYQMESAWSCNEHRLSEEYPKFWYQGIELPDKDDVWTEALSQSHELNTPSFMKGAKYILDEIFK